MVVALLALFIALGGPAQAKRVIDGKVLRKSSVTSRAIKNGTIAKADLSKLAVRSLMATPVNSVRTQQILNGQVLAPDLGAGSVTAAAIAGGAVTASKLAPDSIGGGSVANGSLQTTDIGSFAGAISVDFDAFDQTNQRCQSAEAAASPTGGQPLVADDVVVITPPAGWSDFIVVTGKPAPNNAVRLVACWIAPTPPDPLDPGPDPPSTVFRYVTFDSP